MKKERTELEGALSSEIKKIKHSRKKVLQVSEELSQRNVLEGTFHNIAKGEQDIGSLDVRLLCLLTQAIHSVTKSDQLTAEEWFAEKEIKESEKYNESFKPLELPIVLENVTVYDSETFTLPLDIQLFIKLYHSNLIEYDFDSQRAPKYVNGLPVPDVNLASVREISEHLLNGTYFRDAITLNAYSEESEALSYNPKTKELTIRTKMSILDGFHRLQGSIRAATIDPNIQFTWPLTVTNFDTSRAKNYFGQINTRNQVNEGRLRELKLEKHSDNIVKDLQQQSDSDMKGRISPTNTVNMLAGHLTTSLIISDAIEDNFNIASQFEAKSVSKFLINFFNHLLGLFPEEFILDVSKFKKESYINDQNMFYGYVVLAKKFHDEKIDLMQIKDVIEKINFSKEDSLFTEIFNKSKIFSKKSKNELKNFFTSLKI